jgi:hypothetical protein
MLTSSRGLAQVVSVRSFERTTLLSTDDVSGSGSCVDRKGAVLPAEGATRPADTAGVDAAEACAANATAGAIASALAAMARSRPLAVMASSQPCAELPNL